MSERHPLAAKFWERVESRDSLFLISGPCVLQDDGLSAEIAQTLASVCGELNIPWVFKASYDKANRTSGASHRGPGIEEGLSALCRIRDRFDVPITSDVHTAEEARKAGEILDVIQTPAFLCRQTDLIEAAAESASILNIKKGQFLSPWETRPLIEKARGFGADRLFITERGTTFGYNNLVADMRSVPIVQGYGAPLIFDATHSVQSPGGGGDRSTGFGEFAPVMARAAVAAGARGVFIETHPEPSRSPSDGPNMVPLSEMAALLRDLVAIHKVVHLDSQ